MTVALTGSGSLGVRLGHIFGRLADLHALRGGTLPATTSGVTASMVTNFGTIQTDFANGTALPNTINGNPGGTPLFGILANWEGTQGSLYGALGKLASQTVVAMVNLDQGLGETAPTPFPTALTYLIQQMTANSTTFAASVPGTGSQTAVGSPNGSDTIVSVSVKNPQGKTLQNVLAETLTVKVIGDTQSGATAGNEPFRIVGQAAVTDLNSHLWPAGSNGVISPNAVDGSKSNATGNMLVNSDFLTQTTPNLPDNWTAVTGVGGTDIFVDTSNAFTTAGGSLKLKGTGVNTILTQSFNTASSPTAGAGGTPAVLAAATVYHLNLWLKVSANSSMAGSLTLSLIDGAGAVINDDAGTANTLTIDLTAATTAYANYNIAFRTPSKLLISTTAPYKLQVKIATPIDTGRFSYMGRMSFTPATALYVGGPYLAVHSGNLKLVNGLSPDTWTLAITNTWSKWQSWFARLFGQTLAQIGLQMPSTTSSPTCADSLVA